ncbi:MAG: hypothetical protein SNJ72_03700 [Fimbriimonadales bacterium]
MASCAHCERPANLRFRTGLNTLYLCSACAPHWERRTQGTRLVPWLLTMQTTPSHLETCPHCGTTAQEVRTSGLYGCCLCYLWLYPIE